MISDELKQRVKYIAREQNRKPKTVCRYSGVPKRETLSETGNTRARAIGIREEDVPRLVDEVRRENRESGRECVASPPTQI